MLRSGKSETQGCKVATKYQKSIVHKNDLTLVGYKTCVDSISNIYLFVEL